MIDLAGDTGLRVDLARSLVRVADTGQPVGVAIVHNLNLAHHEADAASLAGDDCRPALAAVVLMRVAACWHEASIALVECFGVPAPAGGFTLQGGPELEPQLVAAERLNKLRKATVFALHSTAGTPELHRGALAAIAAMIARHIPEISTALGNVEGSSRRSTLH